MLAASLATTLAWIAALVLIVGAAAVLVVTHRAARLLAIAATGVVALAIFAAHLQVATLATDGLPDLCRGGATWFGIELTATDEACLDFR